MKLNKYILIPMALLILGCKKEDPIEETPVVTVEPTPEEPQDYGTFSQADMDLLDHVIDSVKDVHNLPVPGFVVGVYTHDRGTYKKGYGVENINTGKHIRNDAIFGIGSVHKLFKWVLGHRLIENGTINPNALVNDYVSTPSLPGVTVMDLFKHSSGLPDIPDVTDLTDLMYSNLSSDLSYDTVVSFLATANGTNHSGASFTNGLIDGFQVGIDGYYSSFGPLILKEIMESTTDSTLIQLTQKYIYQPLGLANTSFIGYEPDPSKLAPGHGSFSQVNQTIPIMSVSSANGGAMHSDVNDLMLLTNGIFNGLLSPSTVSSIISDTVQAPGMTCGQGPIQFNYWRGSNFWGHAGYGTRSHTSTVFYNPQHNVSIVVLTNIDTSLDPDFIFNLDISEAILETLY